MCSRCAAVKPKLPLSVREYRCDNCGLVLDRDRNAAANLARVAVDPAWETSGWVPAAGSSRQHQPGGKPGQGSRHQTNNENTTGSGDGAGGSRRKPSGADGGSGADPHQGRELRTLTSAAAGAGPHGEGTGNRHGGPRLSHQSQQD